MTEHTFVPESEPETTHWRGRLQRLLRRQREDAVRHALIGTIVSLGLVVGLNATTPWSGSPASAQDAAEVEDDARFRATMVGDLMFGRYVQQVAERHGQDALLADVAPLLTGDYVSGNLEQVISDEPEELPRADKLIHLASGTETVDALAEAGFTTVSLANNHIMDHGIPGLRDTIAALEDGGIAYAGAGEDLDAAVQTDIQEHDGLTVATLSFTDVFVQGFIARSFQGGALQAEPDVFGPLIQQADNAADLVIAHFHFGEEYDIGPSSQQRDIAELASQAGADIVVGHHPHVLLPAEMIDDTLVLYSLGNFVFDQGWSRTRESAIAGYRLADDGTAEIEFTPVYIREGKPQVVDGPLGAYRRARIFQRLQGDGLDWQRDGATLRAEFDHSHILEEAP